MSETSGKVNGRRRNFTWFRMYNEIIYDPKTILLSDRQFRAWVNLLAVASMKDGRLPPTSEIAVHLRMTVQEAETILMDLVEARLIDVSMNGTTPTYTPHNWNGRQYQSDNSTERVRKHRMKRFRRVSVTAPDTEAETDTERRRARPKFSENWKEEVSLLVEAERKAKGLVR